MRLTVVHPPPAPPPLYRVELTHEELVGLGLLSYRHEMKAGGTFWGMLPPTVRDAVEERALRSSRDAQATGADGAIGSRTDTGVRWSGA